MSKVEKIKLDLRRKIKRLDHLMWRYAEEKCIIGHGEESELRYRLQKETEARVKELKYVIKKLRAL